jgi:hypothetical protein
VLGITVLPPSYSLIRSKTSKSAVPARRKARARLAAQGIAPNRAQPMERQWPLIIAPNGREARDTSLGKIATYDFNATGPIFYGLNKTVNLKVKLGCAQENHLAI